MLGFSEASHSAATWSAATCSTSSARSISSLASTVSWRPSRMPGADDCEGTAPVDVRHGGVSTTGRTGRSGRAAELDEDPELDLRRAAGTPRSRPPASSRRASHPVGTPRDSRVRSFATAARACWPSGTACASTASRPARSGSRSACAEACGGSYKSAQARSMGPRQYPGGHGSARALLREDAGLVRAGVRRADPGADGRLAGDRDRRPRPDPGADRLRQDARRLPATGSTGSTARPARACACSTSRR